MKRSIGCVGLAALAACSGTNNNARPDTGARDVPSAEVSTDLGAADAGVDVGVDAPATDTGPRDVGAVDTGPRDVGAVDTGPRDAGVTDAPTDGGSLVTYTERRDPCTDRNPLRNAYFGDLHVHTSYSFDSYVFGNRNDPAAAYRFARGEEVPLAPLDSAGNPTRRARLSAPLDFAAVTDHSEFLGERSLCTTPGAAGYDSATCRVYRSGTMAGFAEFGLFLTRTDPSRLPFCGVGGRVCTDAATAVWRTIRDAAEGAYDRTSSCRFTSFVAYEWTATTGGSTMHRNVIFRNANVFDLPVSYIEESTAPGLWSALQARCITGLPGCDVLAIPHNLNISNGNTLALEYPAGSTEAQQRELARTRAQMEPLWEIMQHKGASECSSRFSAPDELCGFELMNPTQALCNGAGTGGGTACQSRSSYARYALADGLREDARLGVNPYRVGFIGSTDTHNGTPGNTDEPTFPGHVGDEDGTPATRLSDNNVVFNPGGLAGVWSVENSRDAIFDAMRRHETFATSGTRVRVRMFGGWDLPTTVCGAPDLAAQGYALGVPMGGQLASRPPSRTSPRFVVLAAADRTPLQQVQIVKGWIDAAGAAHERVVTVAGSATNGASVNTTTCATTAGAGAMSLCGVWTDDQYDPAIRAYYYARVVENPTCRWSTVLCNAIPAGSRPANCTSGVVPPTVQERAWSAPIWALPPR